MVEYMSFWWSKFFVEIAVAAGIFMIIFVTASALKLRKNIIQKRCKHTDFRETPACDAICNNCGKNLGFIGSVRKKRKSNDG